MTQSTDMTAPWRFRYREDLFSSSDPVLRGNIITTFLIGLLPAIAGSAVTILIGICLIWGIVSLALGHIRFRFTRSDLLLCYVFSAFAFIITLTAILGENRSSIPGAIYWLVLYLTPWILIPRYRARPEVNYLSIYIFATSLGAIITPIVGVLQLTVAHIKPEGGAGNSGVYGAISLCMAAIAALNIDNSSKTLRFLAAAGFIGGLAGLFLSGARGVILVAPAAIIALFVYAPRAWRILLSPWVAAPLLAGLVALGYFGRRLFSIRLNFTIAEVNRVLTEGYSANIGVRFEMWKAGWAAFLESPFFGYGVQNRMEPINTRLIQNGMEIYPFSHAHNGFISAAMDGGILALAGVIAVLVVLFLVARRSSRSNPDYRRRLGLAVIVPLIFAGCGLSHVMFNHDIMDTFYVFAAIMVAVSVPATAQTWAVANAELPARTRWTEKAFVFVERYVGPCLFIAVALVGIVLAFVPRGTRWALLGIFSG